MPEPLQNQVVVITGASSGIGRATAIELGHRGASVVLAARNQEALHDAARETEQAGGRAHAVVTDIGEFEQVGQLARAAVERFGRIDTWINNAAVIEYAPFLDVTPDEADQIIRTDLLGQYYGTRAALAVMQPQGHGTIINVGSIESWFGVPYHAAYSAAKHGVKGMSESLRRELLIEGSPIDVCLVLPSGVDTPLFDHARSKLGAKPMPLPPAYPPESVARAIAFACEHPRREIVVGGAGKLFTLLERLNPALLDWALQIGQMGKKGQMSDQAKVPEDNLSGPASRAYEVRGRYPNITLSSSLYTRLVERHPLVKGVLLLGGAAAAVALLGRAIRSATH